MKNDVNVRNLMGERGFTILDWTTNATTMDGTKYKAITFLAATTLSALEADFQDGADVSTPITFPAGVTLFGRITSATITSGQAIAYKE